MINGLTDLLHPCQVMADIMTVEEHLGTIDGKNVVMVGDGNNLANSWLNAASRFPFNFILACPQGYEPDEAILAEAEARRRLASCITHDPREAVAGAHVIYSDAFYSMGQEEEAVQRRQDFAPFQINDAAAGRRGPGPHRAALPAGPPRRGDHRRGDGRAALAWSSTRPRTGCTPSARSWPPS